MYASAFDVDDERGLTERGAVLAFQRAAERVATGGHGIERGDFEAVKQGGATQDAPVCARDGASVRVDDYDLGAVRFDSGGVVGHDANAHRRVVELDVWAFGTGGEERERCEGKETTKHEDLKKTDEIREAECLISRWSAHNGTAL